MDDDSEEEDSLSTSDESCTSEDLSFDDPEHLIAEPPQVLEPSLQIAKVPCPGDMRPRGFRICGDNIDKNVRRRHMRSERQTDSLHYFHVYAVQNRIDFRALSDVRIDRSCIDILPLAKSLLPTEMDDTMLKSNISTLIARVLCTHLSFFKTCFDGLVDWHMQHRYYKEMSSKSLVVSKVKLYTYNLNVDVITT